MSAAGEIRPIDAGWTELNVRWIAEGRPGQFETYTAAGTVRWRAHDVSSASGPTFLVIAAAGPTSTGYDEDTGRFRSTEWEGPRKGYEIEARDVGLRFREGAHPGSVRIKAELPPRDLTVLEPVLELL